MFTFQNSSSRREFPNESLSQEGLIYSRRNNAYDESQSLKESYKRQTSETLRIKLIHHLRKSIRYLYNL